MAQLQASVETVAHQERPEYLDRLSVLRDQVFVLDHMYMSLFSTAGMVLRLALTVAFLGSVSPWLLFLAVFAVPTVALSSWRPAVEREVQQAGARHERLARHLFTLATTASPGKEVRVSGLAEQLVEGRRQAWDRWYGPMARVRWGSAIWQAAGWAVFGMAYVGAVWFVFSSVHASVASLLLVLAAGARLSSYVGGAVGEIGFLRGIWMDGSRRLVWLERYAAAMAKVADEPAPDRLANGITIDHLSFCYPGTERLVLEDINVFIPAGSVVAIVGENGAGKSTLVKVLCKLYEPTSGGVLVDGTPLERLRTDEWRARVSGAFQDFFRFELLAGQSVGVGDLPQLDNTTAVSGALSRAGAEDVVRQLPSGLSTQLGPTWPEGVDVSFGQWQKLALARGFMRPSLLLLVLDEPTAALDAETEHSLFAQYAQAARCDVDGTGRVTLLVSHRFSTVAMADVIIVLDASRLVEAGGHQELMALGGTYAELCSIQARSYR